MNRPGRIGAGRLDLAATRTMDILGFIADNMGHFAPQDIPLVIFRMLCAAFLAVLLARFGARASMADARALAFWAVAAALAAELVGAQLPLAVLLLALVVLAKGGDGDGRDRALRFGALVIGLGCGSHAALVTAAATVAFALLARWAFPPPRS